MSPMHETTPMDFEYRVQGWLPNTTYMPAEIGTNDREAAISAARALSEGKTFYRTCVLDKVNTEICHFVSGEWSR